MHRFFLSSINELHFLLNRLSCSSRFKPRGKWTRGSKRGNSLKRPRSFAFQMGSLEHQETGVVLLAPPVPPYPPLLLGEAKATLEGLLLLLLPPELALRPPAHRLPLLLQSEDLFPALPPELRPEDRRQQLPPPSQPLSRRPREVVPLRVPRQEPSARCRSWWRSSAG